MKSIVNLHLTYRLHSSSESQEAVLPINQYFELEPEEEASIDSVVRLPRTHLYIDVPLSELAETRVVVHDSRAASTRIVSEWFWDSGRSRLVEIVKRGPSFVHRELMIDSEVPNEATVLRLLSTDTPSELISHYRYTLNLDGSETEYPLFPK